MFSCSSFMLCFYNGFLFSLEISLVRLSSFTVASQGLGLWNIATRVFFLLNVCVTLHLEILMSTFKSWYLREWIPPRWTHLVNCLVSFICAASLIWIKHQVFNSRVIQITEQSKFLVAEKSITLF